ncbi:TonB-dependent receptor domain-containing protein [Pseudoalteromonas phenolica]|uniref:TonB-dependent receptor domain-containing protein n=1 Tax=Pseudoalteromonas phenolica TaxID=161398 RepID=UPI00110AEA05|nr:TonB-dependent receptor [Pseudoalteromonas phenolica]TMO57676.1 Fe-regulated protein B [Pseudoalteromonas phenolica]
MSLQRFSQCSLAAAIAVAFSSMPSMAETNQDKDIEKIAVWSTGVKASSMYLNKENIATKQADHLSDLLRTIPGVDVGGAHSLNQRITIRSMDDKDLDISIDGARQNTYMYHHLGNLQIHADILQSVEIQVGSNSVLNGGLGGAVRFKTKQARDLLDQKQRFGGRVQISAGDNSGSNYSVTGYGLLTDDVDFLAYYNFVDRDNYEVGGGKILNENGEVFPGTDGMVKGLAGEIDDALIKFGLDLTEAQRVQFSYEKYTDEGNYSYRPDMGLATDLAITNALKVPLLWPTKLTRDTATINYQLSTNTTQVEAAIYTSTSELWRDEMGWAENPAFAMWAGVITGEATNSGFNILAETFVDGSISQELTYGIDYVKHDTDYTAKGEAGSNSSEEESTTLSLFVQDRIALNDQFTVIPGVRFDDYSIDSNLIDDDFTETSLAVALEFQASNDLLFKLSGTEIFKGPEIAEVFAGAGNNDLANPDIDAETGLNVELSFAYRVEVGEGELSTGATVFDTQINDYIYDYATPPEGSGVRSWKDNIGDLSVDGYEAYINYELKDLSFGITLSDAESELSAFTQYKDLDNARLDRQQGSTISAHANYELSALNLALNWEVLTVSDVDAGIDLDGASVDNSKDGYTVHNISAKWTPEQFEGLTVIFGVDNLFDEYYASQSSRTGLSFHPRFKELYLQDYEPGRNIKATIAYSF